MKNYIATNRNKVIRALFVLGLITSPAAYADMHGEHKDAKATTKATAEKQGTSTAEAESTRKIREAIMNDPSLSMSAKNVTVVTQGQLVTLRGTVNSQAERTRLDVIAKEKAGTANVVNATKVK